MIIFEIFCKSTHADPIEYEKEINNEILILRRIETGPRPKPLKPGSERCGEAVSGGHCGRGCRGFRSVRTSRIRRGSRGRSCGSVATLVTRLLLRPGSD